MTDEQLQAALGFTDADKAAWLSVNGKYYDNPAQGWHDKLMMHAFPKRSAAVYVMPGYQSPASNKWIETPDQRREDFKRTGCRPWEGKANETAEKERAKKYEEQKSDAALDHTVRSVWRDLPDSKKQTLLQGA